MKQVAAEGANIQCPGCRRLGLLGVKCGGRRDLHHSRSCTMRERADRHPAAIASLVVNLPQRSRGVEVFGQPKVHVELLLPRIGQILVPVEDVIDVESFVSRSGLQIRPCHRHDFTRS